MVESYFLVEVLHPSLRSELACIYTWRNDRMLSRLLDLQYFLHGKCAVCKQAINILQEPPQDRVKSTVRFAAPMMHRQDRRFSIDELPQNYTHNTGRTPVAVYYVRFPSINSTINQKGNEEGNNLDASEKTILQICRYAFSITQYLQS